MARNPSMKAGRQQKYLCKSYFKRRIYTHVYSHVYDAHVYAHVYVCILDDVHLSTHSYVHATH